MLTPVSRRDTASNAAKASISETKKKYLKNYVPVHVYDLTCHFKTLNALWRRYILHVHQQKLSAIIQELRLAFTKKETHATWYKNLITLYEFLINFILCTVDVLTLYPHHKLMGTALANVHALRHHVKRDDRNHHRQMTSSTEHWPL